jgi:stage 0 sporulation protein B (sporulation initiation phosphotransferase)
MEKRWTIVDALRHSRHDWLNKIQLIKGNLALNKLERVHEFIEEIIMSAQNEAKLTNLQANEFAELLMTYHWETHSIFLEYEVLGEQVNLSAYDQPLARWCRHFLRKLEECSAPDVENYLTITIDLTDKNAQLFFDFRGSIIKPEAMINWLKQHSQTGALFVSDFAVHNEELTACLVIHLSTP